MLEILLFSENGEIMCKWFDWKLLLPIITPFSQIFFLQFWSRRNPKLVSDQCRGQFWLVLALKRYWLFGDDNLIFPKCFSYFVLCAVIIHQSCCRYFNVNELFISIINPNSLTKTQRLFLKTYNTTIMAGCHP